MPAQHPSRPPWPSTTGWTRPMRRGAVTNGGALVLRHPPVTDIGGIRDGPRQRVLGTAISPGMLPDDIPVEYGAYPPQEPGAVLHCARRIRDVRAGRFEHNRGVRSLQVPTGPESPWTSNTASDGTNPASKVQLAPTRTAIGPPLTRANSSASTVPISYPNEDSGEMRFPSESYHLQRPA